MRNPETLRPPGAPRIRHRLPSRASEQSVELRIDLIGNRGEILWTILEIKTIGIDGQNLAGIFGNPLLVTSIETLKILYFNAFLVLAATLLNLGHKMRNRTAEIDEKVWSLDRRIYHPKYQEIDGAE